MAKNFTENKICTYICVYVYMLVYVHRCVYVCVYLCIYFFPYMQKKPCHLEITAVSHLLCISQHHFLCTYLIFFQKWEQTIHTDT